MASPLLTVIIPTYKRPETLKMCLQHLAKQTIAKDLEVIVASDGHDAQTEAVTTAAKATIVQVPKTQQGVCRNRGLEKATAKYVLFIGDDIFLEPDACEKHLHAHESRVTSHELSETATQDSRLKTQDLAVLGFTTWDPALEINTVMRWLEATGWQFGYPQIASYSHSLLPEEIQHRYTYTSHISLPTIVAKRTQFREDVTLYGWEDIEWGLRLRSGGVRLMYEPDAKAFHHHHLTLDQSLKRMRELGQSAVFLTRVAPELDRLPYGWKRAAYRILALLPTMRGQHAKAFLQGIADGEKGVS